MSPIRRIGASMVGDLFISKIFQGVPAPLAKVLQFFSNPYIVVACLNLTSLISLEFGHWDGQIKKKGIKVFRGHVRNIVRMPK